MRSYNAVNGVPSCANDWLLKTVARGEWGFDGYVTSDCGADNDVFFNHHYTKTAEESVAAILKAGTDVDCGGFIGKYAQNALNKSLIVEADLDERLKYLFTMRMRLGHFDPIGAMGTIPASAICTEETQVTASDGAAQGAALLKNDKALLPLKGTSSVAVIGPNSDLSSKIASYYGPGNVCDGKFYTLIDAVKAHAKSVVSIKGVPDVKSSDTSGIADAVTMAKSVDVVILAIGTDLSWAREGTDADPVNGISLSAGQTALVDAVTKAAKAPVIVVTMTATPLDISAILANPKVGAVLHVGQPAVAIRGVGDVLYGVKPPAGKLIQTIYPKAYATEVSIFDFNMRPGPSPFPAPGCTIQPPSKCPNGTNPGRTYRFYTGKAIKPFGYGLSYTTWKYDLHHSSSGPHHSSSSSSASTISLQPLRDMLQHATDAKRTFVSLEAVKAAKPFVQYAVNVTNTGTVDSDDVVLGFLTPPGAGTKGAPKNFLFGFERVFVKAGETKTVWLYPAATDFSAVDEHGKQHALAGEYKVEIGVEEAKEEGMGFVRDSFVAV